MDSTAQRVALRYAKEFSTPEALKDYLHEHPKADPSKHTVHKPEGKKPSEGEGDKKPSEGDKKPSFKEKLKGGLHKKLLAIKGVAEQLKNAPAATKKFFSDTEHRKSSLKKAGEAIRKSPSAYVKNLVSTAKHEVHEFKEAGHAIKAVMSGKKPTPKQMKAVKTVATHMAITAAAAAMTSATPALMGMAMGKAMAKHVALKAVTKALGDMHILQEVGHIGHGIGHILTKLSAEEVKPEDALAALVMKHVTKEIESLSDEDIVAALQGEGSEGEAKEASVLRVALRYQLKQASVESDMVDHLKEAQTELKKYKAWAKGFPSVLNEAKKEAQGLPEGLVWQDQFRDFWQPFNPIERRLIALSEEIENLGLDHDNLANIWMEASHYMDPPRGARIEDAISHPKFFEHPKLGSSQISYPEKTLQQWHKNFSSWVEKSIQGMSRVIAKAQRKS